jgi:hypothetical protein
MASTNFFRPTDEDARTGKAVTLRAGESAGDVIRRTLPPLARGSRPTPARADAAPLPEAAPSATWPRE